MQYKLVLMGEEALIKLSEEGKMVYLGRVGRGRGSRIKAHEILN